VIFQPTGQLDDVRAAVGGFDPLAVATAAAALQVIPDNSWVQWRLEALAGLAAGHARRAGQRGLDVGELRRLLTEGSLASMAGVAEDPFEEPFAEEVAFHGGSFLVGAGMANDASYVHRLLSRALLLTEALPGPVRAELVQLGWAALAVSDAALRGAGLQRNAQPTGSAGELVIPPAEDLVRLQQAMAFSLNDLSGLVRGGVDVLEPLIADAGDVSLSDAGLHGGGGDRFPLLRAGDWVVLARPFGILTALRHRMAPRACEEIGTKCVSDVFGLAVDNDVADALHHLMLRPELTHRRDARKPFTEMRARCDTDKVVVALVVTDDFEGMREDNPHTLFASDRVEGLHQHLETVAVDAAADGDDVLGLVVVQAAGRAAAMGMRRPEPPNLTLKALTAANLDVIAFLEANDPLALWKFAKASDVLVEDTRMQMFSPLDGYGVYRDAERSFAGYRDATLVLVPPGAGAEQKREMRAARDRHGEPGVDGKLREVERTDLEEARAGDVYHCLSCLREGRLVRFVGGAPIGLWASGPQDDLEASWDVVEAAAYWLGELREPMAERLTALATKVRCVQVEVALGDRDFWLRGGPDPDGDDPGSAEVLGRAEARITPGPALLRLIPQPDNAGERLLVGLLVDALDGIARRHGLPSVAKDERAAIVDAAATLGVKKHLLFLPVDANPMMERADDRARTVQEADLTAARVSLGDHLREVLGYRSEHIPHERRNEVLHSSVKFLFGAVRRVVEGVRSDGLLEQLMAANERLIAQSEHRRTILPAREATYPLAVGELREEVARTNQASVCCRFLVEYAAAQPPHGAARWSMARYDEALASASVLVDWGNLSDAVRGDLTTMDLLVRDDGQLRLVEYDRYEAGRGAFYGTHIEAERERSRRGFAQRFSTTAGTGSMDRLLWLDSTVESEAGVTLTELGETLVAANIVARELDRDVVVLPRAEALATLAEVLERPVERLEPGVSYLSMGPRDDFLRPPTGRPSDTYPWLFARRWSYNRRPFVVREREDGGDLLWGRRQVVQAMNVLIGQMTSGRYQALAESAALRSKLGGLAKEDGAAFECKVAALLRKDGHYDVSENVKRLGTERLQRSSGETLGDIDVLVADRAARTLWAVECKNLSGALTAAEVAREMSDHFGAAGTTSVTKHAERVGWLEARVHAALERLGIEDSLDGWSVRGIFVTGRPVHAPYIDDVPVDVVPVDELLAYIQSARSPSRST
jgi:hypothetical protein